MVRSYHPPLFALRTFKTNKLVIIIKFNITIWTYLSLEAGIYTLRHVEPMLGSSHGIHIDYFIAHLRKYPTDIATPLIANKPMSSLKLTDTITIANVSILNNPNIAILSSVFIFTKLLIFSVKVNNSGII
jgi:hypothetical protein